MSLETTLRPLAATVTLALAAGATAEITTLPASNGLLEGISATGVAAGSFGQDEYFIWTPDGGWSLIGGVTPGNGIGGQAQVSEDGLFVCGTVLDGGSGLAEMARYDVVAGTWTQLGGIGGQSDAEVSSGWGISGDGRTVVGLGWAPKGGAHAIAWNELTGLTDLGSTVDGSSSRANGANHDGSVVVGWQDGAGRQGAVWVDGVQELIFLPDGAVAQEAFAASADGRWVTGIDVAGFFGVAQAYRYDTVNDVTIRIPNLAVGGQSRMTGTAISEDGSMIVGGTWGLGPATLGTAIVWREGVGTTTFPEYLDEIGVAYDPTYTFAFVSDMSDDGRWMVGWGRTADNQLTSWILEVPEGEPCPGDLDGSGDVGFDDLLSVLAAWGGCAGCPQDLDGDDDVDFDDLLSLIAGWGDCP